MAKTIISERWELIPLEQKKLLRSFGYAVMAVVAFFIAQYLEQFGLPEELKAFAPFIPVAVNFLRKFAGEHTYKE